VGGGGGARGGPGGGGAGAGAGSGAAAVGERQPDARAQVPERVRQDVRQRGAGVRARARRRRRARPRLRGAPRRRPLHLRRRRAPPRGRRPHPPQVLPGLPRPGEVSVGHRSPPLHACMSVTAHHRTRVSLCISFAFQNSKPPLITFVVPWINCMLAGRQVL
jgi:hypothetical protein